MGLHKAGFDVEGWDIKPQKNYPFKFHLGDALQANLSGFEFVWASPPCQAHSSLKTMPNAKRHLDLIPQTRAKLNQWTDIWSRSGLWIIENVIGAPLVCPIMLCGTMFGLGVKDADLRRHRIFESNATLLTLNCQHRKDVACGVYGGGGIRKDRKTLNPRPRTVGVYGNAGGKSIRDGCQQFSTEERKIAMGIDWMSGKELSQAIPPAYSEFLGRQIIKIIIHSET